MTASDDDLIQRGDARRILDEEGFLERSLANLNNLPAVQVAVTPLRYVDPEGETLDQMREHARQHPLARKGDMKLVWVNEGDLYHHSISALTAQPSPEQVTAYSENDVAALVEAVDHLLYNYLLDEHDEPDLCVNDDHWSAIHDAFTAIARVKGGDA